MAALNGAQVQELHVHLQRSTSQEEREPDSSDSEHYADEKESIRKAKTDER